MPLGGSGAGASRVVCVRVSASFPFLSSKQLFPFLYNGLDLFAGFLDVGEDWLAQNGARDGFALLFILRFDLALQNGWISAGIFTGFIQ